MAELHSNRSDGRKPHLAAKSPATVPTLPVAKRKIAVAVPTAQAPPAVTIQSILAHALDTFGSKEKMSHWMTRPNPLLQGKTPEEAMTTDLPSVEAALGRIDFGVYA